MFGHCLAACKGIVGLVTVGIPGWRDVMFLIVAV